MVGCLVDASFPKMAYGFRAEKDRPRHLRSRNLKGDLNRGNESFNKTNYGLLYLLKFRLSSQFSLWAEVETDMDDFTSFPWGRNLRWDKLLALVSMEVRAFLFQSSFPSSLVLYFTYSRNTDWIPSREELNGQTWFRALLVRPLYIPSSSFLAVFELQFKGRVYPAPEEFSNGWKIGLDVLFIRSRTMFLTFFHLELTNWPFYL